MKNLKELGPLASIVVVSAFDDAERDAERVVLDRLRGEMGRLHRAFLKGKDGEEGNPACLECKHCTPQVDKQPDMMTMETRFRVSIRCKTPGPCVKELERIRALPEPRVLPAGYDDAVHAASYAMQIDPNAELYSRPVTPQPAINRDLPATSVDAW